MGWPEALLIYRAADNFQGAALVAQDRVLLKLAAAWPQVKKTTPSPPEPGQEVDLLGVWSETSVDFEDWARLTQLPALAVLGGFEMLKGNGLILPDGTLNHLVETLLQKEAAGVFMSKLGLKPGDLK
jgi:hypothetical protein